MKKEKDFEKEIKMCESIITMLEVIAIVIVPVIKLTQLFFKGKKKRTLNEKKETFWHAA